MQPIIRNAIARIDVIEDGRSLSRGTGFLVAEGIVLTALHVVADRNQPTLAPYPGEILLTFPGGTVKAAIDGENWDRRADWVLLRCASAPDARPIPQAELNDDGGTWETYGFPDANPRDGMANIGEVSNHLGTLDGNPVFQLFSREAAAGQGAPLKGLSGSPVIVQNAVVGLLRFALMKDGQTVAGTVYACPIASVLRKTGNLLPLPDPCFGLPGLPRQPLPADPFRNLAWFTAKEAEVFFGRNREIRQMYQRLTAEDAAPVLLLYGQSGVGKSSFLDAGLLPRLRWYHQVCYLRRDAHTPLVRALRDSLNLLGGEAAESAADLAAAWQQVEHNGGKPLVVFFDQMEEVYTHPNEEAPREWEDFARQTGGLFSGSAVSGRLVLSFRKEWLPEIQKQMELNGISYAKVFLEGLDRSAVMEAITGLTGTDRLRQFYGLTMDPGLPEQVAADVLSDPDSAIAPTLQILLTKMWRKATAESRSAPKMTAEQYRGLRQEGLLLSDFLDQQLAALKSTRAEWVESGLALDVLACHTTSSLSSRECTLDEMLAFYKHRAADIPPLLQALQELFLLSDSSRDDARKATRLCHDTLAPVVRHRFATSESPGQRARRIVEGRVDDWKDGSQSGLLDEGSLEAVEQGFAGMRVLTPKEQSLIAASRVAQQKRRRARRIQEIVAVAGVAVIFATAVIALLLRARIAREKEAADLSLTNDESGRLMDNDPGQSLLLALAAVGRSRELQHGQVVEDVQRNLAVAVEHDLEVGWAHLLNPYEDVALAFSSTGVVATGGELVRLWNLSGALVNAKFAIPQSAVPVRSLAFSPDGKLLAASGNDGDIHVWDLKGNLQGNPFNVPDAVGALSIAFSPAGDRIVSLSNGGSLSAWSLAGQQVWKVAMPSPYNWAEIGSMNSKIAVVRTPNQDLIIAAFPDGRVGAWDLNGHPVGQPFQAADRVFGVAAAVEGGGQVIVAVSGADQGVENEELMRAWYLGAAKPTYSVGFPRGHVTDIAAADGNTFAAAMDDGSVHFIGQLGLEVIPPVYSRDQGRCGIAFFPGGRYLAMRSTVGDLQIQDTGNGMMQGLLGEDSAILAVAFSPKGDRVANGTVKGAVWLWSMTGAGVQSTTPPPADPNDKNANRILALAWDADGKRIATGHENGVIRVWNADDIQNQTGQPVVLEPPQPGNTTWYSLAFLPDGQTLLSETSNGIWSWDLRSGQGKPILENQTTAQAGAKNPPLGANAHAWALAIRPDGQAIALAQTQNRSSLVGVWDLNSKPLGPSLPYQDIVRGLAFSPDGSLLLSTDRVGTLNIWRLAGGMFPAGKLSPVNAAPINDSLGFNSAVRTAVSRDGQNIFTAGKTASMWSVSTGQRIASFPDRVGVAANPATVSLSPDGTTLAGGKAYVLFLWRATWQEWLQVTCDRIRNHPVLSQKTTDAVQLQNVAYAKGVCQELVWSKEH